MRKFHKILSLFLIGLFCTSSIPFFPVQAKSDTSFTKQTYDNFTDIPQTITIDSEHFYLIKTEYLEREYLATFTKDLKSSEDAARITHSYPVTVIVKYKNFEDIEEYYYYSEYNDTFKTMFGGTLHLSGTEYLGSSWNATYTGNISGNI